MIRSLSFLRAVGTMIGGIVGVGVFGLPYAISRAGVAPGLLVVFGVVIVLTLLQLMVAEVAVQTGGTHRIVGYVRIYLGKHAAALALGIFALGLWGALTAYIIIGGSFLEVLAAPVFGEGRAIYSLLIAFISGALMFRGIKFASKVEMPVVAGLFFLFGFIILASVPHVNPEHFTRMDLSNAFLPYGVALFAAAGTAIVPEMRTVLGKQAGSMLQPAVLLGMLLVLILYIGFSLAVVGVTGPETTPEAFSGLIPVLGPSFAAVAALLGTVTILSIYTVLGVELMNMLRFDYGVPHVPAWVLTAGTPVALFLFGVKDFIELIGFIGGALVGLIGVFLVLMYERMRRSPVCIEHKCLNLPHAVSWIIVAVLIGGSIWEIARTFG